MLPYHGSCFLCCSGSVAGIARCLAQQGLLQAAAVPVQLAPAPGLPDHYPGGASCKALLRTVSEYAFRLHNGHHPAGFGGQIQMLSLPLALQAVDLAEALVAGAGGAVALAQLPLLPAGMEEEGCHYCSEDQTYFHDLLFF